ncbi:VOC family protein [Ferruginivarius sediminum]|uniref:VOC family protein n=1 Tax=Ferruginivarius sediminum TaxID=2661937 RepID=UPI00137A4348|nr:VOC family protein [Ferruginivarius sediminum]
MSEGITGLDHLLIGVNDLEAGRAAYERLGFRSTPRGRHIGWGTANYCLMFGRDYLELLGIVDPSQFTNNLDVFLAEHGEGLLGAAFAGDDLDSVAAQMQALNKPGDGPKDLKRTLELPEGDVLPEFRLYHLPPEATPGLRSFVCQHLTPEIVWQAPWVEQPNGARRIAGLTVVVDEPGAMAVPYGELFGLDAVRNTDNVVEVTCGACVLRFTDGKGLAQRHPQAVVPARPGPAAMEIAVADLPATASYLRDHGVAFERGRDGRLHILPDDACGAALDFV